MNSKTSTEPILDWLIANVDRATIVETPGRSAAYAEGESRLHPKLMARLAELGIERPYAHQAEAWAALTAGQNVVVSTSTGSGKTLCYNAPVLDTCLSEPNARALYLFPTKALAHDQLEKLSELTTRMGVRVATYDRDTPKSSRHSIRSTANIVLTNPDMLHIGILPHYLGWAKALRSLRFIVLDEMHAYGGLFGSHVAWVLRRLLRLCERYGSRPRIIACSATVDEPLRQFELLTGEEAVLVDRDCAAQGRRRIAFVSPEEIEERSATAVAADVLAEAVRLGYRSLAFCKSRIGVELLLDVARGRLSGHQAALVESYRSGYTAEERRALERALREGDIAALATTNAMELGVDVGDLDLAIVNGYPGSVTSFRQQIGRAGRGAKDSTAIFLAHGDPLERLLTERPEILISGAPERSPLSTSNRYIAASHLRCMAHESPIRQSEIGRLPAGSQKALDELCEAGEIDGASGSYVFASYESPARNVNLRGAGQDGVVLVFDGRVIGDMERARAMREAHQGAVYLHRGGRFLITRLDLARGIAELVRHTDEYRTKPVVQSLIRDMDELQAADSAALLSVEATCIVSSFLTLDRGGVPINETPLQLPPETINTIGLRFDVVADQGREAETAHTVEHLLAAVAPFVAGCAPRDLSTAWYAQTPRGPGCVYLYDPVPGGIGLAEALFERRTHLVRLALELANTCECEGGCHLCLLSPRCEVGNSGLNKRLGVMALT